MRTLIEHEVFGTEQKLEIVVADEPGQGGACHVYRITKPSGELLCEIKFQNGPIVEYGVNGVTQEALLAIIIDRLNSFNDGPFKTRENALARTACEEALHWLHKRTSDRLRRGVEGKNVQ